MKITARATTPRFHNEANAAHTREAVRARSLKLQQGPVWDAYAGCERSPLTLGAGGWR